MHMPLFGFCLLNGSSNNTAHIESKQRQMKRVDKKSIENLSCCICSRSFTCWEHEFVLGENKKEM